MTTVGVQMIHACGHAGYHVVEEVKDQRAMYNRMHKEKCDNCLKRPGYVVISGHWAPNKYTKVVDKVPAAPQVRRAVKPRLMRITRPKGKR